MNKVITLVRYSWMHRLLELLITLIIIGLCGFGIDSVLKEKKRYESDRLRAIVDLQAHQITDWLDERRSDAEIVGLNPNLLDEYQRWINQHDLAAAQQLQARLARLSVKKSVASVSLYDAERQLIWSTDEVSHDIPPELTQLLAANPTANHIQRIDPYLDRLGHIHLDYAIPLIGAGPSP
ncbi:hypothetical protein SAMN05421644_1186 [Allochromatium warmingii]|uniref:Uncharacterized protein n=1 Tax=Allochromatium warmingii TaxID=61595 RepID=A0A1H3FFP2_ALLWA|nr:cache domain-containing protein [Allochromatium warmingii]SDX88964.1 hypothetical protein SAMN05421644_1186 [Allochromatium warmingii]